jgi:hypothetical protein
MLCLAAEDCVDAPLPADYDLFDLPDNLSLATWMSAAV